MILNSSFDSHILITTLFLSIIHCWWIILFHHLLLMNYSISSSTNHFKIFDSLILSFIVFHQSSCSLLNLCSLLVDWHSFVKRYFNKKLLLQLSSIRSLSFIFESFILSLFYFSRIVLYFNRIVRNSIRLLSIKSSLSTFWRRRYLRSRHRISFEISLSQLIV